MLLSAAWACAGAGSTQIPLFYCTSPNFSLRLSPPQGTHLHLPPKPSDRSQSQPRSQSPLHHVSLPDQTAEGLPITSAAAVAATIRLASPSSPVEFTHRVEKNGSGGMLLPSLDFQRLCTEQLDLFRMVVEREAVLSVYVRPAGSYVMDQLELRRVAFYPGIDRSESAECVILVGNFSAPTGLRAAEAALSKQQVEILPEFGTVVLPMVKHPFIVGFVVAELPNMLNEMCTDVPSDETLPLNLSNTGSYELPQRSDKRFWEIQSFKDELMKNHGQFTTEKRSMAIMISRSLAMAYVMDQKALLLQQSSWQNNVRMSHLVEQIRGALSSIMSLSKMLSLHLKRSQISFDIVEDILAQGDHMKDALQLLQDAVYLTKANILRYNDETLNKLHDSLYNHRESVTSLPSDNGSRESRSFISQQNFEEKDMEMPMPPPLLLPLLEHNIRQTMHCFRCIDRFGWCCSTSCR